MEAASRKKLQIVAKYPFQDIQQCFHQVLREVTSMTINIIQCTVQFIPFPYHLNLSNISVTFA